MAQHTLLSLLWRRESSPSSPRHFVSFLISFRSFRFLQQPVYGCNRMLRLYFAHVSARFRHQVGFFIPHPIRQIRCMPLTPVKSAMSALSGLQNVVDDAVASLPSVSKQLDKFTTDLTKAVDETVHKLDKLKENGTKLSSDGHKTCQALKVVVNNSYNYTQAIDQFTWHARRGERQKLAFQEASKEGNPNFRPMHDYIQHIKRFLGRAGKKYEIFRESCKGVVERLEVVSEETQKSADEAGSKKTASQVTGGVLAGGAMAAGVGTGAAVAGTGIGLSLAAGIPTLGIGTIIGLTITAVAAPVVGLSTGTAAAVGTHFVAKHYNDKKKACEDLVRLILSLERQASKLDHVLNKIKISMDTFDNLTQDVEYYTTAPHHQGSLLDSMRLLFEKLEEFHSVCSKCCELLKKKSEDLETTMMNQLK